MYSSEDAQRVQMRASNPLEMELQAVLSCLTSALGTKLGAPVTSSSTLDC